jgi:hypothetical protein
MTMFTINSAKLFVALAALQKPLLVATGEPRVIGEVVAYEVGKLNQLKVHVSVSKEVSREDMIEWVQEVMRQADPQRGEIHNDQVAAELERRGLEYFYEVKPD